MRYKPGDTSISARDINRLLDALDAKALGDARTTPASGSSESGGGTLVKIKNETGVNLRAGEVVELSGYGLSDDYITKQGFWWFRAKLVGNFCAYGLPLDEYRLIAFCREPIPAGAMGLAQIGGLCPVLIDVQSTDDTHGYLQQSQRVLKGQGFWGHAEIIRFRESTLYTGEQLVLCNVAQIGGSFGDVIPSEYVDPPTD